MTLPFNSWLTNTLRPSFGLLPMEEAWDILEIRKGYFVCMEGDMIRKRISVSEQASATSNSKSLQKCIFFRRLREIQENSCKNASF